MTGIGRLHLVVFDAADIAGLAEFYVGLTGWRVSRRVDHWITLDGPSGPLVAFQRAPDHVAPEWPGQHRPQQLHLDFDALPSATGVAIRLGARKLAEGPHWVTLADPAGHPFDLVQTTERPPMSAVAIHVDAPDPSSLARFYAELLGMQITHDTERAAAIAGYGKQVIFVPVEHYNAPRWPDPAYPQQAHLDVRVADLAVGEAQVLALGATHLHDGDETFTVFADPAGHPFCLVL